MLESRWVRWVGPGVIAVAAVGSLATLASGASPAPWTPSRCATGGDRVAAARTTDPARPDQLRLAPWYRVDPRLDRSGTLAGQRLSLGTDGARASHFVDLPAESFAAGPFGRLILVGRDDGVTSTLAAIDAAAGCAIALTTEPSVIRRATIDPGGTTVYEMRVDRATRADLGIWSAPLDGTRPAVQVLGPIEPDDRFGPTFSTEFAWDASNAHLAVQSCGESFCRVRVLDPASGAATTVDDPDLGSMVGLDRDRLVAYEACPGLPCPIVAIDVPTGERQVLADAASVAVVVATADGARLVHEVLDASGIGLRSVALDGSASADLGRLADGLRLQPDARLAEAATRVPTGFVLVTPEGRIGAGGPGQQTLLRHVPDGASVQLQEAIR